MITVKQLVDKFSMLPHPEGGWYKETYRSNEQIEKMDLPDRFNGSRCFSTAIYFLLENVNFSAFHRIKSDECWHFYMGGPLNIYVIHLDGSFELISLGNDIENGDVFQYVVPANCWFASKPAKDASFSFVGCTVAPGFDFNDFELAKAEELAAQFPQHRSIIHSLCRQ